jgi:hypothetical protein
VTSEQRNDIAIAWTAYRAASMALPRRLTWPEFVAADELLWRQYLDRDREILGRKGS